MLHFLLLRMTLFFVGAVLVFLTAVIGAALFEMAVAHQGMTRATLWL